jgi:8-amino-7-oxononanoate synthase
MGGGVMDGNWRDWLSAERERRAREGRIRSLRALSAEDGFRAEIDGRRTVLFSSNDYLGLSSHPRVTEAAADAARRHGMGPRGASLICGYTEDHAALEADLASHTGSESALLFPTGFAANLSVLTSLAGPDTAVFSDERNHASIIDGCRLARQRGARVSVYRHADVDHLDRLLGASDAPRKLVVTDTVFSMDGDVAPLEALVGLRARHGALLAIDEAHAMLVFGETGGGAAQAAGVREEIDVLVGTLGKAIGAHGGFAACDGELREHLLNAGRAFIYSTALPRPVVAAARAGLAVGREEPEHRERLWARVRRFGEATGLPPRSPVFPILLGTEERAVRVARALLDRGYFVPAIRPPTVAPDSSRLRVTLSAAHSDEELEGLIETLGECLAG